MMGDLIEGVRQYALAHYNEGGWDIIFECFEDDELAEEIEGCKDLPAAIEKMAWIAKIHNDRRREIQAEIF